MAQTKKKRPSRRVADSDITRDADNAMQVDEKPIVPRQRNLDSNFVDDDDLQAALARSRKAKLQKKKKLSPEEIARRSKCIYFECTTNSLILSSIVVAEERERSVTTNGHDVIKVEDDDEDASGTGLTFDDTSEFVRAITYDPVAIKKEPPPEKPLSVAPSKQPSESRDLEMKAEDEAIEELEAGEVVVKEEDEDDEEMLNAIVEAIEQTEAEERAAQDESVLGGTSTEQTYSSGMASTLNILRNQGILATPNADNSEREQVQLQRDLWLADYRRMLAQRDLDRAKMRGGNKDQATREYENRLREQQDARQNLDAFKNYKPDVNIVYYDEFGRELSAKEAWKALSHKFHGKGSGKMKTEKRLKKIAEEKKQMAMSSGDTPLSMNQAFQIRQEKAKQPHFILSVGNRGYAYLLSQYSDADQDLFSSAVPQAAEFLDAQPLSKGKTEKKNKKKNADKVTVPQVDSTGFITLPANGGINSPGLLSGAITNGSGSPAPRPGFSRITSAAVDVDSPRDSGTPVPADRGKLVIGLGKRKAGEEAFGTPPPKRR